VIAIDTSSCVAYLSGASGKDVIAVEMVFAERQACLPPAVLAELLSDPRLPGRVAGLFRELPLLAVTDRYWERVGLLRSRLIARGRRAPLADSLIAQSCLDHDVPLVTRDADFGQIARITALRLLP
jgi:predicted nucleic acid-binding protein